MHELSPNRMAGVIIEKVFTDLTEGLGDWSYPKDTDMLLRVQTIMLAWNTLGEWPDEIGGELLEVANCLSHSYYSPN